MPNLLFVMAGGAIGAGARHLVGQIATAPYATLIVNLLGGLLMGLLAGALARDGGGAGGSSALWLFLGVGMLGGFTTFSAFSLDAVTMIGRGAGLQAALYVLASVAGAMALFAAGLAMGARA